MCTLENLSFIIKSIYRFVAVTFCLCSNSLRRSTTVRCASAFVGNKVLNHQALIPHIVEAVQAKYDNGRKIDENIGNTVNPESNSDIPDRPTRPTKTLMISLPTKRLSKSNG